MTGPGRGAERAGLQGRAWRSRQGLLQGALSRNPWPLTCGASSRHSDPRHPPGVMVLVPFKWLPAEAAAGVGSWGGPGGYRKVRER